ncbi:hypothetical protein K9N50_11970 [bacterium]|nr:hypothetical protein [bacterium]
MNRCSDEEWEKLKECENLKEYIFLTRACYRHFFVLGKDLKDAEENFMRIDILKRKGFTLDDLPIRLKYTPEVKHYKKEELYAKNENKKHITL